MENGGENEFEKEDIPEIVFKVSHETKLKELLRNITCIELRLYSDASKEFIKLLRGNTGGELLRQYIQTSSKCSELLHAWKLRQGKSGLSYVLSLISVILSHADGKYKPNNPEGNVISRALDKFARMIIEEKLVDVCKELNSKEAKRQNAALQLLASIVRRSSGLALDVAKNFDFKLPFLPKLAEYRRKQFDAKGKHSTRRAFVGFAMSFLESGKPGLLKWVLQQKELYSGVLRGLGNDDDETVVYVLSTLRDKVLTPESLVRPSLRSVLFGSVTLDQLINISGRTNGGLAEEIAHHVLIMVCTDPSNGLMPDLKRLPNPLRGNPKRLLNLMKKLKATDVKYHRDLLLAIANGRPSFGSAYMDEFPYHLEDHASPTWFGAISLVTDLVSSAGTGLSFDFLDLIRHGKLSFNSPDVQSIMKCLNPRPVTRLVINKGLLHSDSLVKHGILRLLLEILQLMDSFICAINCRSCSNAQAMQMLASLKQDIENEVRILLPDPQVLLSLLSPLNNHYINLKSGLKRAADAEILPEQHSNDRKKLKTEIISDDIDILVAGISASPDMAIPGPGDGAKVLEVQNVVASDSGNDHLLAVANIWGLHSCISQEMALEDSEMYFHSKLLEALRFYHRAMPTVLEGSFDFFKVLPSNPLSLPTILQQSLLSLLIEHIGWSPSCQMPSRIPPLMYKHLHPFIILLLYSPIIEVRSQANVLAQAAMLSTGAFDKFPQEIGAWFLFLPGYGSDNVFLADKEVEVYQNLSPPLVLFLCDAVSTLGNNIFKYWDLLRSHISQLRSVKDISPNFSPVVICVLEKCLRLLNSESGTFTLPEKSVISLYVCNTIKYLLQTQVEAGLLSALIDLLLSERLGDDFHLVDVSNAFCEWRPLKNLLLFVKHIANQQIFSITTVVGKPVFANNSFVSMLHEVKRIVRSGNDGALVEVIKAFYFSMLCTTPSEILQNFPSVISISTKLLCMPLSLLSSIFSLEQNLLGDIAKLWPELFFNGLKTVVATIGGEGDAHKKHFDSTSQEEIAGSTDIDSKESASVAFGYFLKQVPFYVLFPSIVNIGDPYPLEYSLLQDLLLAKLSELTSDYIVSSFRLVLFWIYQIQSSYRVKQFGEMEQCCEMCFTLIDHMLTQLLTARPSSGYPAATGAPLLTHHLHEVAETIFCHPLVMASLECPLVCSKELTCAIFGNSFENFLNLTGKHVHTLDHHVLKLLMTTSYHLSTFSNDLRSLFEVDDCGTKQTVKAFKILLQKLFLTFMEKFNLCIKTKDMMPLVPMLYTLLTLVHFISPFELLELVHWVFSSIDLNDSAVLVSSQKSALYVGLYIADGAFETLSAYFRQPKVLRVSNNLFWKIKKNESDVDVFEKIYFQVFYIATRFEIDIADLCMLKAVNAVCKQKFMREQCLWVGMLISRVIAKTPIAVVSHCIHRISMIKAKLLLCLTEVSSLHMSVFGYLFSEVLNKYVQHRDNVTEETCDNTLSDEGLMMLLPVALSYLNSSSMKFAENFDKHFRSILSVYLRIIWEGFVNWNNFVLKDIFEVECGEFLPSSMEDIINLVNESLLGKAIQMLQHCFALFGYSIKFKKRLKLFNSVFQCDDAHELLGCDVNAIDSQTLNQSLNFVNRVVYKISFCRIILFHKDNEIQSMPGEGDGNMRGTSSEVGSSRGDLLRIRFINTLVHTWHLIIKKFPFISDDSVEAKTTDLLRVLEVFLLRNIFELTTEMRNELIHFQSLPFLEQLAKSSLLYRFEDPKTLKILRKILILQSEGKFSSIFLLQLLVAHSQFAASIHSALKSSSCSQVGVIFRPMSGILRSLIIPCTDQNVLDSKDLQASDIYARQLEVIKLLRVLFHLKASRQNFCSEDDININYRELLFLLLSSYGATLSEIDLEIYNLMEEIEFTDESNSGNIAEMDYLWGSAALKIRKEREQEQSALDDNIAGNKAFEECRRNQFRENLPIDPKLCAATVLYFPYDRTFCDRTSCLNELLQDNSKDMLEKHVANIEKVKTYDPVFVLRFSMHSLSMGYIEPLEFASLGLLAVALVSMSSPDSGIRKLSYETLVIFKTALENCQRKKDVMQLRLLLTYLQNGIEESGQRIPSVTAIFVAEASLLLFDPSNDRYATISKLLMESPRVNLKNIPFFHKFFWSCSVNFHMDRLWMLRLLYAGLNLEDDAKIYIRDSIPETLLSFYASSLSDSESKELILQIVKKSVKLHKMACYLVEKCGLISWLSSIVSFFHGKQCLDQRSSSLTQLKVALEVVSDVISLRNIMEWLQNHALEQLSELASHLHRLLLDGMIRENIPLVTSVLHVVESTLKISQKRKIFQPHFTLSVDGLFHICHTVDGYGDVMYSPAAEFGLRAVLMGSPPLAILHVDPGLLLKFVSWAVSTALWSDSKSTIQSKEFCQRLAILSGEEQIEDSLLSKLLRWLTASVIRGRLQWESNYLDSDIISEISNHKTLESLFEKGRVINIKTGFECEYLLAVTIFYLQQLVGINCMVLPSVVSALCLLFSDAPQLAGWSGSNISVNDCPVASLRARIRCPVEANPFWRWSFYQPWKDLNANLTSSEKMDEVHACQTLLMIIGNMLGKNSLDLQVLLHQDLEISGLFKWERSIVETE